MNFLALAAILSTVGMYGLSRYVGHAKTAEAVSSVATLAGAAAEYYNGSDAAQPQGANPQSVHAMRHFPPGSRIPVPEDRTNVRGRRYQSNLADWGTSPWRELRFSIVQPQYYRYSFESQGSGGGAHATVTAEGDIDGDGIRSNYSVTVVPDETLIAHPGLVERKDSEE